MWNFLKTISCVFLFALSPVVPATNLSPGYSASPSCQAPSPVLPWAGRVRFIKRQAHRAIALSETSSG